MMIILNMRNQAMATGYKVIDLQTKLVLKQYGAGKREVASRFAEKRNLQYGAHRYAAIPLFEGEG